MGTQKQTETWVTEFTVQPFIVGKGRLRAQDVQIASSPDHARRMAERLARHKAGVIALSRRFAPSLGEYDPAVILAQHGDIPGELLDALSA